MDFHGDSRDRFRGCRFRGGLHGWSFRGGSGGGLFPAAADGNGEGYHRDHRRNAGYQPFGKRPLRLHIVPGRLGGLRFWVYRLGLLGYRFRLHRFGRGCFRLDRLGRFHFRNNFGRFRFRLPLRVGEHLQERVHALRTILRAHMHTVRQNVELRLRQPWLAGQRIVYGAVCRGGRENAGAAIVDGGGHGVNVRPRTDLSALAVLLNGAESVLGHHLGGLDAAVISLNVQILRRAQIQQNQLAVRPHHDVVRADVPVDNAVLMDFCQCLHDGGHEFDAAVKVHGAVLLQFFQEGFALDEVHDDVGRFVLDENRFHPHDAGNAPKLCHFPGFLQETVKAFLSAGFSHHGAAPHYGGVTVPADHAGAHGIVFLDGNLLLQQQVKADVGDAKTALTQHFAHEVLSLQNRSRFQGEGLRVRAAVGASAFRADGFSRRQRVHTFHASAYFHFPFLFLSGASPPIFGTITVK